MQLGAALGTTGSSYRTHAHITLLKQTAHLVDGLPRSEFGVGDKSFNLFHGAFAFPLGRTGIADALARQNRRNDFPATT